MDNLIAALLKGLGLVCLWCAIIIALFLCLYFTIIAFDISVSLGFVALFVDAVLVATLHYYEEPDKKPTVGE